jgi:protocatechuate 3,4-dioxygenase beta subunit
MELHDDDKPVGRVLSRREALTLLGGVGAAMLAGTGFTRLVMAQGTPTPTPLPTVTPALPNCVVRPELTEGPYFVDEMLNRSDIRVEPSDDSIKEGTLLRLIFNVSQIGVNTCLPLAGAQVDVWHCDAEGVYSGVQDRSFDTSDLQFLRGYQVTDENGQAEFLTIYPGWYQGRTVHIHFKIRTDPEADRGYEFTSQLFFDDDLTDEVYLDEPYAAKGIRTVRNNQDNIYRESDGLLTLELTETDDGYIARFDIGLDVS